MWDADEDWLQWSPLLFGQWFSALDARSSHLETFKHRCPVPAPGGSDLIGLQYGQGLDFLGSSQGYSKVQPGNRVPDCIYEADPG